MYSNFDFIFYPFLLIDIDCIIMYDLCSFFRAARYSAITLYRHGEAEREPTSFCCHFGKALRV